MPDWRFGRKTTSQVRFRANVELTSKRKEKFLSAEIFIAD